MQHGGLTVGDSILWLARISCYLAYLFVCKVLRAPGGLTLYKCLWVSLSGSPATCFPQGFIWLRVCSGSVNGVTVWNAYPFSQDNCSEVLFISTVWKISSLATGALALKHLIASTLTFRKNCPSCRHFQHPPGPLSVAVWPAPVLPRAGLLCNNMVYSSHRLRGGLPYLTGRKKMVPEKENMNTHEFMFQQSRKEWGRTEDRAGIKF